MLLPLLMALTSTAPTVDLYIGTYTSKNGSKGIYHARLDTSTGAISQPELAVEALGPSFMALHPSGDTLYAVHEPTNGDVSAYRILPDRKLKKLNTQSYKGSGPCHLAVDGSGRHLLVASYTGGSLGSFPIQPDGSLGAVVDTFQNTGTGPNERRQEAPHMHGVASFGSFVYACDLGTDEVLAFKLGSKGELTSTTPRAAKSPPGGGPRHVVLHPNGGYLYANNEMLNSVSVYAVDKASGVPKLVQTLSTLPEGEGTGGKSTAEIACHPSGKWLYVSNRGHDSIAAFAIQPDGKLKLVKIEKAGVENPRGFDLDPSGNWLVVAGQSSDDLTSLQIDPASGKLRRSGVKVRVDKPVCVVFVK